MPTSVTIPHRLRHLFRSGHDMRHSCAPDVFGMRAGGGGGGSGGGEEGGMQNEAEIESTKKNRVG